MSKVFFLWCEIAIIDLRIAILDIQRFLLT